MRLCLYFCRQCKRGGSYSKIHKERRLKSIVKTLFRVLIDCIVQNIFECLFATVDLMWVFKVVSTALCLICHSKGNRSALLWGETAHQQIAARLNIPFRYYKKMQSESPDLLDQNVNRWLNQNPERRMIRVLDGKVRA